jgi:hypothetical protein
MEEDCGGGQGLTKGCGAKGRKLFCIGVKLWSLTLREEQRLITWEQGAEGNIFDLRGRKWCEAGEDCIMRSFITCTLH